MNYFRPTEVCRTTELAYGLAFVVCANTEVLADMLDLGLDGDTRQIALEAAAEAQDVIYQSGFDYANERLFRMYHGGPRAYGIVEPLYFVADIDADGCQDDWKYFAAEKDSDLCKLAEAIASEATDAAYAKAKEWLADEAEAAAKAAH